MKLSVISKGLLLGMALLLATSAFASNKGSMNVQENLTVSGKQLSAGDYQLQWEGSGPNVEVNILRGKKVVATVPARLVDINQSPSSNASIVRKNADGSRTLTEVRFSGKKYALAIGEDTAKAETSGSTQ
ncbi:MAG: hypothetical protein DMG73_12685 [Acidobacteria bacterium]|jgi:hypothetical protein|nr:MAG: hypothetical protein DMG73_12685 [Acidobacteriota bacterium]PYX64600.1 MAG: hypothetical protein DMG74_12280 [Acidobacteriota bacterium]